jgi:hypothetical protein
MVKKIKLPKVKNPEIFYRDLFLISLGSLVELQENQDIKLNESLCEYSLASMVKFNLDQLGFKIQTDQPSSGWKSYFGKKGRKLPQPSQDDLLYLKACGLLFTCCNVFDKAQSSLPFEHKIQDPNSIYGEEAKKLWEKVKPKSEKKIRKGGGTLYNEFPSQIELDFISA